MLSSIEAALAVEFEFSYSARPKPPVGGPYEESARFGTAVGVIHLYMSLAESTT